jgi:predicted ATPase
MLGTVFVNREEELKRLSGLLADAESGNPRLVFVCGESGIGKRSLVEEFLKDRKDLLILRHDCTPTKRNIPYGILSGLLDNSGISRFPNRAFQDNMRSVLKSLETRKGDIGEMEKERQAFHADVVSLFKNISNERTCMMFINNYQWVDKSSSALLEYLGRNLEDSKVIVIAAYSAELEGDDVISSSIAGLTLEGHAQVVLLERFDEPRTKMLLEAMFKTGVTDDLVKRIFKETQGHPLFTSSLLKSLVEEKLVDFRDEGWMEKLAGKDLELPKDVRGLISRRVKLLDKEAKNVLRTASVLGILFRTKILAHVLGMEKGALRDVLSRLTEGNLIYQDVDAKDEIFNFDHVKVRETVYNDIGSAERKRLHRSAGEAYEAIFKDRVEFAYIIAHHFSLCGLHDKAFSYAKTAGERALNQNAPEEAIKLLNESLKHLKRLEIKGKDKVKQELLLKLGDASFITGDWKQAQKFYTNSLKMGEKSGDKRLTSLSNRKLGELLRFKGDYEKARRRFEEALTLSRSIKDSMGIADSYKGLGYLFWRKGDYQKAIEHYDRCIDTARKLKDDDLLGVALLEKGNVCNTMGDLDKAMDLYESCVKHLEKANNLSQIARVYNNMGDVCLQKESWSKAMKYFERSRASARNVGGRYMIAWSLFNEAEALANLNKPDEAIEKLRESHDILKVLGDKMGLLAVHKNFAIAHGLKRDWQAAEENFRKSLEMANELNIPDVKAEIHLHWAIMLKAKGEKDEARSNLSTALEIAKGVNAKRWISRIEKEIRGLR